jgi:hypothetical protein
MVKSLLIGIAGKSVIYGLIKRHFLPRECLDRTFSARPNPSQRQEILRLDGQNGRSSLPECRTGDTILTPLT